MDAIQKAEIAGCAPFLNSGAHVGQGIEIQFKKCRALDFAPRERAALLVVHDHGEARRSNISETKNSGLNLRACFLGSAQPCDVFRTQ
ncbi:hypothetical protein STA1M1_16120 [Sinisalibacter aestuarii]|uniref:Uncharacterized protein n=1 Tax=Sinisalibacter aestuarii TaxID=2949426 RepID=A0ABQ5LS04_9RHOB|nr:hypothetical protein STA1M1_16120 [Sinisalibacter aestuarii]